MGSERPELTVLVSERSSGEIRQLLTRRQVLIAGAGGVAAFTLAGCGSSGPSSTSSESTPAAGLGDQPIEDRLVIANYTDYLSPANVDAFTAEAGPKVKLVSYSSGQEMISKLSSGAADYDIVVPGPSETAQLAERDLLMKLDKSLIPNFENVRDSVRGLEFDPSNDYTVPKAVGVASFWWNEDTVKGTATSLAEAFELIKANPDAKVNFFDTAKETFTLALAAIGKPIASTDPADIEEAKQLLISVKPFIDTYGVDELEGGTTGRIDLNMGYNYGAKQINDAAKGKKRINFLLPETGSTEYFIDNWAIPSAAKNVVAAHAFIDFISAPEPAAEEMNTIGILVPINGIEAHVDKALADDPTINIPEEKLSNYEVLVATPEYLDLVTKAYDEFRAA